MILVSVGGSQFPFDRLLRALDGLSLREALVVQHGSSAVRPSGARCIPFLPVETLVGLIRDARAVVTHAGAGSILLSLTNGKRPYVVPRLQAFGETVDDHQLESARRFARAGLVTLVEDPRQLVEVVTRPSNGTVAPLTGDVPLVTELREYLGAVAGAPAGWQR